MKVKPVFKAEISLKEYGLKYEKEYKFHPSKKYRFDFAFIDDFIAVEIEGGTFCRDQGSRHIRGVGYRKDCEKYNAAVKLGWRVLRYTTDMLADDDFCIVKDVKELMGR